VNVVEGIDQAFTSFRLPH